MKEKEIVQLMQAVGAAEIHVWMDALLARYKELYPEWEIHMFSIKRGDVKTRKEQLARILEMADRYGPEWEDFLKK